MRIAKRRGSAERLLRSNAFCRFPLCLCRSNFQNLKVFSRRGGNNGNDASQSALTFGAEQTLRDPTTTALRITAKTLRSGVDTPRSNDNGASHNGKNPSELRCRSAIQRQWRFAIRCGTGKPVPDGAILWRAVDLRAYEAINHAKSLGQYMSSAKYFAFRQGARLRGVASGYISVLATKHQRKRRAPNK